MQAGPAFAPATARVLTVAVWKPRIPMNVVGRTWLMTASTNASLPA